MSFGLFEILKIIGALGLFIYGMKVMSEGLQRAAGSTMRNILRKMTKNKFIGVLSGLLITALVQSSSATTVMVVSFVNAGLLSLVESAGIIMGANIGTTITGWLVAFGMGKFDLSDYVLPILGLGLPLVLVNRGKSRFWGEFLIGFTLLFLGLNFLKISLPNLQDYPQTLQFLSQFTDLGYISIISFVIVGTLLTIIIQSSSAAMALTLVMVAQNWIPLEIAAAMILGENIGTTITAEIAALVGNIYGKRAARIHTLFNILGVCWMVFLLPFFVDFTNGFVTNYVASTLPSVETSPLTIAIFHTIFNILNAAILISFIPWLILFAKKTIRAKEDDEDVFRLEYITTTFMDTSELSIIEVQKEVSRFGELTSRMSGFARELLMTTDKQRRKKLAKRIKKYEEITNHIESEMIEYLSKVSRNSLSDKTSERVRKVLTICSELEEIGNLFLQLEKVIGRKHNQKIWFNQTQRDNINQFFDLVDKAFDSMTANLSSPQYDKVTITIATALEDQINKYHKVSRKSKAKVHKDEEVNLESFVITDNLYAILEKIGDNIFNVTETLVQEN